MRILVADKLADEGLEYLKSSGANYDVKVGLKEDELSAARRQIAELQRKVGEQQVDLDFFRKALRHIEETRRVQGGPGGAASTKSSKR